jgi:ElaB/YqjD/DUF883 family membrane-anchored ribosome-binding protein
MATHFPSLELPHVRRARERLILDLHTLARDAERMLDAAGEDISDQARAARRQFARTAERIRETTGEWRERGTAAIQEGDRVVRENPYRTVGVAFGVGVVVGLFIRGK